MMRGKDFDRGLNGYKMLQKVLMKHFIIQFKSWCESNDLEIPVNVTDKIEEVILMYQEYHLTTSTLSTEICDRYRPLKPLMLRFRNEGCQSSPTFKVWDNLLFEVLAPMLVFLGATGNAKWSAYQEAKSALLPFLFISNRTMYAKYMSVLQLHMEILPKSIVDAFNEGLFEAKLADGNFNSVWADYALEVTENKALKGKGGIIGLTLRGKCIS